MKKLLAGSFVIAVAAVLLSFSFTRARRHAANGEAPQPGTPKTETTPQPKATADIAMPGRVTAITPPQDPAPPDFGVTLKAPGVAPIMLTGRSGAPSEKTLSANIERTDLSDAAKARTLIEMLPKLPPEILARAAEEAVTRLSDTDYTSALGPTLINPQTRGMAMSVLFADLMQRPDSVSLPILATIAQDPKHPYSQNARENLQFLLRQDFGNDWARWNEAIRNRIGPSKR